MKKELKTVLFTPAAALGLALAVAIPAQASFELGPLKVGGAIRANYVYGDYNRSGADGPERGGNGGDMELDTFRVNLDYQQDKVLGKLEYRWYNGYNFLHTGWVGYQFSAASQLQVGLNRVPFGVGDYGPANNWFFDQHYYLGLADDMDLGLKYSHKLGRLALDLGYYLYAEPSFLGDTEKSARYSYDIVDGDNEYGHYRERNQLNIRAIYSLEAEPWPTELGISLQWGELKGDSFADDSSAWAASLHSKTSFGNAMLMLQLSRYRYAAHYHAATGLNDDLIAMGAYDFAWPVASSGLIPAIALSYTWKTGLDWIDSITFYDDYSINIKDGQMADGRDFNNSAQNVLGMAIASGGWYIYVDYAYANGNYFIGNDGDLYGATYASSAVGDFGANLNDQWRSRFNINFGYYF